MDSNNITLSDHQLAVYAACVSALGNTWGGNYLRRIVTEGEITDGDAAAVLRRCDFPDPMPWAAWAVKA
jgi:succinate dehydrogenase/fumarate reductase flavoprotein subunit